METRETLDRRNLSHTVEGGWIWGWMPFAGRILRRLAFEVLRLFRPLVLPFLFWLAIGGVALWIVFVGIAHDTDFPTARVLMMSVGCLLGFVGYSAALELLRPARR